MADYNFKRLRRTMMIYRVVQAVLLALLAFVAVTFQQKFVGLGQAVQFMASVKMTVAAQLVLFYPVYRLALRDVNVELEGAQTGLNEEQSSALRKKRLLGDMWKFCGVGFYLVFATLVPGADKSSAVPVILAATIFSFLLTCLMYFQCFNYGAAKRIRQNG